MIQEPGGVIQRDAIDIQKIAPLSLPTMKQQDTFHHGVIRLIGMEKVTPNHGDTILLSTYINWI